MDTALAATDCGDLTAQVAPPSKVNESVEKVLKDTAGNLERQILEEEAKHLADEAKLSPEEKPKTIEAAVERCWLRTGRLLATSSAVTGTIAMGMEFAENAPGQFWKRMGFNLGLMTLVGTSACLKSRLGDKSVAAVAAATSAITQAVVLGKISIPDVLVDGAWIYKISIPKTRFVLKKIDEYRNSGGLHPKRREYIYQLISEAAGSAGMFSAQWALHSLMAYFEQLGIPLHLDL